MKATTTATTGHFPKLPDSVETVLSIKTATTLHWEIFKKRKSQCNAHEVFIAIGSFHGTRLVNYYLKFAFHLYNY